MLFYTYQEAGTIYAVYSGRFAFLHCRTEENLEKLKLLRGGDNFASLKSAPKDDPAARFRRILAHEFGHNSLLSISRLGRTMTGWRPWARARYLRTQAAAPVEQYYKARAVYLHHTRTPHEQIVSRPPPNSGKETDMATLSNEDRSTIARVDEKVLNQWKKFRLNPRPLVAQLYELTGRLLQRNFAASVSYLDSRGEWKLYDLADRGVINDIYIERGSETNRQKRLKRLLVLACPDNSIKKATFNTDYIWFLHGQRAQRSIMEAAAGIDSKQYARDYVDWAFPFVLAYCVVPEARHSEFITFAEDAVCMPLKAYESKWSGRLNALKRDPSFQRFIHFFYRDGN